MGQLPMDYNSLNFCYSGELQDLYSRSRSLFEKRIWRVTDVAEFMGCSKGHVYNLSSDEKIPKVKKGKFIYFIPEAILNWIMQGGCK
jgi:predicted DNA-binding transcriptional regulator AlpA